MEEQLISFETAKLAKEKGFNIRPDVYTSFEPNGDSYGCNKYEEEIIAPTQSLLQKWLRELTKKHIVIVELSVDEKYKVNVWDGMCTEFRSWRDKDFNNYEDALELGLQQALKLI